MRVHDSTHQPFGKLPPYQFHELSRLASTLPSVRLRGDGAYC
jgi:hypothetical protein